MTKNFSQKGFTANFLTFMKDLEKNRLCCLDFLTRIYTEDSATVTFTGEGTKSDPLIATATSSGSGTVTSVGLTGNSIFDITGSPVTVAGDINLDLTTQAANTFFAGPGTGPDATPTFRPLVASDIPPPLVNNGLSVNSSSIGWGQPVGAVGDPAALLEDRQVPLNNFSINFSNGPSVLGMDMLGFAASFRLLSTTFFTIGSDSNFVTVQGARVPSNASFPILQLIVDIGTNQGTNQLFSGVVQGFNVGGGAGEPLLITTSAGGNDSGFAGDIIVSPGRAQGTNFTTQIARDYNIFLQPCGIGFTQVSSKLGIGSTYPTTPTAKIHVMDGSTGAAGTAPLKFTSGTLLTTPEIGAIEFVTDKWFGTITTATSRKEFTLNDTALTTGRVPFTVTNGRLTSSATFTYNTGNGFVVNNVAIIGGTAVDASAQLEVASSTLGFLPPRMSTAQKNAIVATASGLMVYDTDLNKLCVFGASAWETITSV